MPGIMRLNQKELLELIEDIEGAGGDATEFRTLMAEVSQDSQYKTKVFRRSRLTEEEPTAQERLESEAGHLFPNGITDEILDTLIAYDKHYNGEQLKEMRREVGLSPYGHKKLLAARLLAHQRRAKGHRVS